MNKLNYYLHKNNKTGEVKTNTYSTIVHGEYTE